MKRILLSLLAIAIFLTVGQASAKVTVYNNTPYPIAAWVKYDFGHEDFPGGSVEGEKYVKEGAVGILPYKSDTRTKDAAQIKRWWKVWVKQNDIWELVISKRWVAGGGNVNATVFMTVDPESGENNFDLQIIRGRRR